jgi:hypothetical protein
VVVFAVVGDEGVVEVVGVDEVVDVLLVELEEVVVVFDEEVEVLVDGELLLVVGGELLAVVGGEDEVVGGGDEVVVGPLIVGVGMLPGPTGAAISFYSS